MLQMDWADRLLVLATHWRQNWNQSAVGLQRSELHIFNKYFIVPNIGNNSNDPEKLPYKHIIKKRNN